MKQKQKQCCMSHDGDTHDADFPCGRTEGTAATFYNGPLDCACWTCWDHATMLATCRKIVCMGCAAEEKVEEKT